MPTPVCGFSQPSSSATPAGHAAVQLSSDTFYLEVHRIPRCKGLSPTRLPSSLTSDLRLSHVLLTNQL